MISSDEHRPRSRACHGTSRGGHAIAPSQGGRPIIAIHSSPHRVHVFGDARMLKPQLLMLFTMNAFSCRVPSQSLSSRQARSRWSCRGGRQMAVQPRVHPTTEVEWKPVRRRVIAPESLVTLPVPARNSSRNGSPYFVAPGASATSTDGPSRSPDDSNHGPTEPFEVTDDQPGRQSVVCLRR
jgi:hypothetical protein